MQVEITQTIHLCLDCPETDPIAAAQWAQRQADAFLTELCRVEERWYVINNGEKFFIFGDKELQEEVERGKTRVADRRSSGDSGALRSEAV